jgi:catecholate siderophore receptor
VKGPITFATTDSLGVYAFDSIALTEKLLLNLGVRYDEYSVEGRNPAGTPSGSTYTPVGGDWDFVNYQIGLVYKPTENSSVYASYSTSSTPPITSSGDQSTAGNGTGSGDLANTVLDPEETASWEIGAKANLFNDRLAVSGAAFILTRENAQILVGRRTSSRRARSRCGASSWACPATSRANGRCSAATPGWTPNWSRAR